MFALDQLVTLRHDVLNRHSQRVPAHAGYSTEQFRWRDTLANLFGKTGRITRLFPNSKHVNVDFDGVTIGIDYTELAPVN